MSFSRRPLALAATTLFILTSACTRHTSKPSADQGASLAYLKDMAEKRQEVTPSQTKMVQLENGLKLYLISEPSAAQSAVSVRVGVGSYSDPAEYRGLAHYLEHVLFLGSKKYPVVDEFMNFVGSRQGSTNAYTRSESTNYMAAIRPEDFAETVDRLAQFFVAPNFDPLFISKEIQAIQSEYDKNLQSPVWQFIYLYHSLFKPQYISFQGNNQTLGSVPREVVKKFFEEHYSATNTTVVLTGPQPISELEQLGRKSFAAVPVRQLQPSPAQQPLVQARVKPSQFIQARIVPNTPMLFVNYTLPPVRASDLESKSLELIQAVLGDEQEGSLAAFLKAKGWASGVDTGSSYDSSVSSDLTVQVKLTEAGLAHWREIASGVMAYVQFIRESGYTPAVFANVRRQAELRFIYDKEGAFSRASQLAEATAQYGFDHTAERSSLMVKEDASAYLRTVRELVPEAMDVILLTNDFKGDQTSEFYNISYMSQDLMKQDWAKNPQPMSGFQAKTPQLNPYLPKDLTLVKTQDESPQTILQTPGLQVELQRDREFRSPLGYVGLRLKVGPQLEQSQQNLLLGRVLAAYVKDALTAWSAVPNQAGLGFELIPSQTGAVVKLSGYSDRLPFFAGEAFKRLAAMTIEPQRLERVLTEMKRGLANRQTEDAYKQAMIVRELASYPKAYTDKTVEALVGTVTLEQVSEFKQKLFASGQVKVVGFGNLSPEQTRAIGEEFVQTLGIGVNAEVKSPLTTLAPKGVHAYVMTRTGANNAWMAEYHIGPHNAQNIARVKMIDALLSQPFFTHMRTEMQYGYIAQAFPVLTQRYVSIDMVVQSEKGAVEVATEGRRWLRENYLPSLKAMSAQEFEAIRASVVGTLRQPDESLEDKFDSCFRNLVLEGSPSKAEIADAIEKMQQADAVADIENVLIGENRREFSVYVGSGGTPVVPADEVEVKTLEEYWQKAQLF